MEFTHSELDRIETDKQSGSVVKNRPYASKIGTFLSLAAIISGLTLLFGAPAQASGTPAVHMNQVNNLDDGQNLLITWTDFPPSSSVTVRECARGTALASQCSRPLGYGDTDLTGSGNTIFTVTRTNGLDIHVPGAPFLKCNVTELCEIRVADASDPTIFVSTNITFVEGPGGCAAELPDPISGKGTAAIQRALVNWGPATCKGADPLGVDYVAQNDVFGLGDFQCSLVDFAATDQGYGGVTCPTAATPRDVAGLAPIAVSGVTFAFNLRDSRTGSRINHLELTPDLLAQIFTGQLTSLDMPAVKALNPGINLPDKLNVAVRADQNAATLAVTTYLNDLAHDTYILGGDRDQYTGKRPFENGPVDTMPSIFATATTGEAPLLATLMNPDPNPISDPTNGWITYLSSPSAEFGALATVTIVNADDSRVSANTESFLAGVACATKNEDGSFTIDTTPSNSAAYPLTTITEIAVPKLFIGDGRISTFSKFITWAITDGQDSSILPLGYAPLPLSLARQSLLIVNSMSMPAPSESPSPSPSPSDTAVDTGGGDFTPLPEDTSVPTPTETGNQTVTVIERTSAFSQVPVQESGTSRLVGFMLVAAGLIALNTLRKNRA